MGSEECLKPLRAVAARIGLTLARSFAVKTAFLCSSGMWILRMRPCATVLRTKATSRAIGKPEIGDILAASAQKPVVFLARNGRSDSLVRHA